MSPTLKKNKKTCVMSLGTLFLLLLGTGCGSSVSKKQIEAIQEKRQAIIPEQILKTNHQVQYFRNFKPKNLPVGIDPTTISSTYELEDYLFNFITSPTSSIAVLLSTTRGKSWETFFDKQDKDVEKIPIGLFVEEGELYLDLLDEKQKNITRYKTNNTGATWKKQGCYDFNQNYFLNGKNQQDGIAPTLMTRCQ